MIILGLDPGLARTGFGVIDTSRPDWFVRCGCLITLPQHTVEDRLLTLGNDIEELLTAARPDIAVVEQIFFGTNTTTALLTAHARGVLIFGLRRRHIAVETLTPLQIKSRLTGHGRATKQQVQHVTMQRLRLVTAPQPDDAADALAAALCIADSRLAQV